MRKKLKQPSFAAGVHRDEVYAGAELLQLSLDEHIANVRRGPTWSRLIVKYFGDQTLTVLGRAR